MRVCVPACMCVCGHIETYSPALHLSHVLIVCESTVHRCIRQRLSQPVCGWAWVPYRHLQATLERVWRVGLPRGVQCCRLLLCVDVCVRLFEDRVLSFFFGFLPPSRPLSRSLSSSSLLTAHQLCQAIEHCVRSISQPPECGVCACGHVRPGLPLAHVISHA